MTFFVDEVPKINTLICSLDDCMQIAECMLEVANSGAQLKK